MFSGDANRAINENLLPDREKVMHYLKGIHYETIPKECVMLGCPEGIHYERRIHMSYFPMFIDLQDRPCLIAGGGRVALRKVEALNDFGAHITVIAPTILPEIKSLEGILYQEKSFEEADLEGQDLVVAATDDKELNHKISIACKKRHTPVNAVDQTEDCTFIFPAYLKEGEVVAAFSSGGQSPVITQYLKEKMRPVLTQHLGNLAACLGSLRETVKEKIKTEAQRKKIYQEILRLGLEKDTIPSEEEIQKIIEKV